MGRREGGGDEERDRGHDGAGEDAGLAGVEEEAGAPGGERDGDAVGGPAEGAVKRIGERGADEAEGVAGRLVGGAEEARIVGVVGPDHRRGEGGEADEDEADELGAAAAERALGVALHQRRAAFGFARAWPSSRSPGAVRGVSACDAGVFANASFTSELSAFCRRLRAVEGGADRGEAALDLGGVGHQGDADVSLARGSRRSGVARPR